jgi:hypothetical protein
LCQHGYEGADELVIIMGPPLVINLVRTWVNIEIGTPTYKTHTQTAEHKHAHIDLEVCD